MTATALRAVVVLSLTARGLRPRHKHVHVRSAALQPL